MYNKLVDESIEELRELYKDYKENYKTGNITLSFNFFQGGLSNTKLSTEKTRK